MSGDFDPKAFADGILPAPEQVAPAEDTGTETSFEADAGAEFDPAAFAAGGAPFNPRAFAAGDVEQAIAPSEVAPSVRGFTAEELDADTVARHQRLRVGMELAHETDGTKMARALKVAQALDIDFAQVLPNLEAFERAAEAAKDDPAKFERENVMLARMLSRSPELAPVVKVDKELGALARALNAFNASTRDPETAGTRWGPPGQEKLVDPTRPEATQEELLAEEQARRAKFDAEQAEREKPVTRSEVDSPEARAIRESAPIARQLRIAAARIGEGFDQQQVHDAQRRLMLAEVTQGDRSPEAERLRGEVWDLQRKHLPLALGDDTGFERNLGLGAEGAVSTIQMGVESVKGAGAGGAAGAVMGGVAGGIVAGPAGITEGAVLGAKTFGSAGATVGLSWGAFQMELVPTYRQNRELKTESGEPIEAQAAFAMAVVESAAKASLESISFGVQTQALKGAIGQLTGAARRLFRTDATFRKLLQGAALEVLKGGASEGGTGAAQDLVEQIFEYVQKNMVDDEAALARRAPRMEAVQTSVGVGQQPVGTPAPVTEDGRKWPDFKLDAQRTAEAGWAEAMGGVFFGGFTATGEVAIKSFLKKGEDQRTEQRDAAIPVLAQMMNTETGRAAPAIVAEGIREETSLTGEPVEQLYLDGRRADAIIRRFQKDEEGFEAAATELLGEDGPAALREAAATWSRVPFPLEKLGAFAEGLGKELLLDITTRPNSLTPRERQERKAELEAQAKKEAAEMEGKLGEEQELASIKEEIVKELVASGSSFEQARADASVFDAMYRTAAADTNGKMTPRQVFDRYRVQVFKGDAKRATESDGQTVESLAAKEAPISDVLRPAVGEDVVALLREYVAKGGKEGASLSTEERARHLFVDRVSGLGTVRAWQMRPRTPGKRVLALTTDSAKAINDYKDGGHVRLDDLLRLIGAPLQASHPEAVRAGVDFWLEVADEAEAQEVLDFVRQRLPEGVTVEGGLEDGSDVVDPETGETIPRERVASAKAGDAIDAKRASGELPAKREESRFKLEQLSDPKFRFSEESARAAGVIEEWMLETVRSGDARPAQWELDDDFIREAFFDPKIPGVLNALGAEVVGARRYAVSMDGIGLKDLNKALGKPAGNVFLELIMQIAVEAGAQGVFFAHRSGDEFEARHDDPDVLANFVEDFQRLLSERRVLWEAESGERFFITPQIRYGIAEGTYADADRNLNERKRAEDPLARRPSFREAGQGESAGDSVPGRDDLDARRRRAAARRGHQTELGGGSQDGRGGTPDASFDAQALTEEAAALEAQRPPSQSKHTAEGMAEARKWAERKRPFNRQRYTRFLDFVEGWERGVERPYGALTRSEEIELLKLFNISDPELGEPVAVFPHGYKGARKKTMAQPFELAKHRPGITPAELKGLEHKSPYRRNQANDLRTGAEALPGLDPVPTKHEFAQALEARYRLKFLGGKPMDLKDFSTENEDKLAAWMASELLFSLTPERIADSGINWYTTEFQEALDMLATAIPSLKDKVNRDHFTILLAISSNGEEATQNFANAVKLYKAWEASHEDVDQRRFDPAVIKVSRGDALYGNIVAVNELVKLYGTAGTTSFLLKEHKVSELNELAKKDGLDFESGYSPDTTLPMSALVLGPKLGAFWANLMGLGQYLTMDMWAMRMVNRMRGSLTMEATPESLERLRTLLGAPKMGEEELLANIIAFESERTERNWRPDIARRPEGMDPKKDFNPPPLDKQKVIELFREEAMEEIAEKQAAKIAEKWAESGEATKKRFDPDGSFRKARLVPPAYREQQLQLKPFVKERDEAPWQRAKKAIAEGYLKEGGRDPEEAAKELGYHDAREMLLRVEIERVAHGIHGRIFSELREAPAGSGERGFVIRTVEKARLQAQAELDKDGRGVQLNTAAVQAILWFYEKRLYKEFNVKGPAVVSYKDSSRQWLQANGFLPADAGNQPEGSAAPEARGHVARGPGGIPVATLPSAEVGRRRQQLDENPELRDQVEPVLRDLLLEQGIRRTLFDEPQPAGPGVHGSVMYEPGGAPVPAGARVFPNSDGRADSQVIVPVEVEFDGDDVLLYEAERRTYKVRPRNGGPETGPRWAVVEVDSRRKRPEQVVDHLWTQQSAEEAAGRLNKQQARRVPIEHAWAAFAPNMAPELRADVEEYLREVREWSGYREWLAGSRVSNEGEFFEVGDEVKVQDRWARVTSTTEPTEGNLGSVTIDTGETLPVTWNMRVRRGTRTPPVAVESQNRRRLQEDDSNEVPVEGPRWWSAVERAAAAAKQAKNTASAWWSLISKTPGVKKEELDLMGLEEWLKSQKGTVKKEAVLHFIQKHRVQVTETVLSSDAGASALQPFVDQVKRLLDEVAPKYEARIRSDVEPHWVDWNLGHVRTWRRSLESLIELAGEDDFDHSVDEGLLRALGNENALRSSLPGAGDDELIKNGPFTRRLIDDGLHFGRRVQYSSPSLTFAGHEPGTYKELLFHSPLAEGFESDHFFPYSRSLIGHTRVAIHKDTAGRRILVTNEVQSDAHQAARRRREELIEELAQREGISAEDAAKRVPLDAGYSTPGSADAEDRTIPPASTPLKSAWDEFIVKRLLMLAVENGLDRVAWTTGMQQSERADQVEAFDSMELHSSAETAGKTHHLVLRMRGQTVFSKDVTIEEVTKKVGEDTAQRLLTKPTLKLPKPMKVAGEGMRLAYDVRLPSLFRKLVKPFGGQVTQAEILTPGDPNGNKHLVWVVDVPQALRDLLKSEGAPIMQVDDEVDGAAPADVPAPPASSSTPAAPAAPAPAQRPKLPPKGYYFRSVQAGRALYQIFRNPRADASTVIHEAAHAFLDMLQDMASQADASAKTKAKWADALAWMGVTEAEWADMEKTDAGRERKDALHEKWAESFEVYLSEGKAPSKSLARVFTRFKLWLVDVFRSLKRQRAPINNEIRSLFDRLLATDDERRRAFGLRGEPLFTNARDAGMSEEGWRESLQQEEEDRSFATKKAEEYAVKQALKETSAFFEQLLAKAKKEAEERYDALPAAMAQQLLGGNAELKVPPVALDRTQVEAVLGKDFDREKVRTAIYDGMPIDEAALQVGQSAFPTGAHLVKALVELKPREQWVQEQAEAAVKADRPDVVEEREKLAALVAGGLQSWVEKKQLEEWDAIASKAKQAKPGMGAAPPPPVEVLKRAAALMAERRSVASLQPGRILQAERSAAKEKARAAVKGEHNQAIAAAKRQLLNSFLYKEVLEAKEEAEKLDERFSELSKPKALAKLGLAAPEYRNAVAFIVETFGRKRVSELEPTTAEALRKALDIMVQDGAAIGEPDWFIDLQGALKGEPAFFAGDRMSALELGSLTVKGMRAVADALKALTTAANQRRTVLLDDKRVEKSQVIADILVEVAEHKKKLPPRKNKESTSDFEAFGHFLSGFDGFLRNPIDVVRELTGDDQDTTLWRLFVNPMRRAKFEEARILQESIKPIIEAMEAMPDDVRDRLSDLIDGELLFVGHTKAFSVPTRRHELLMLALNTGNESNLQRLRDGRNITNDQIAAALSMLTKAEIDWVNSVWAATESLRPRAFDLEERLTGLRPEGFKRTVLKLPNGTLTGGYVPAVYESSASNVGERQNSELAAASVLNPTFTRPNTPHSHLKKRADKVEAVISLSVSNVYSHLAQVAHDIAFREVLLSAASVLLDGNVQTALKERLGEEKARQFRLWLQDVGAAAVPAMNRVQQLQQVLKGKLAPVLLGWKASTALGDFANLPAAVASTKLELSHLNSALASCMENPGAMYDEALKLSKELSFMRDTTRQQFKTALEGFTKKKRRIPQWYRDHAFDFMEGVQKLTATPIWVGAYRQALAEKMEPAAAARWADDILTQVFPSHSPVEQSAILRDKGWAGVSMTFYGYLSTAYRAQARILSRLTNLQFQRAGLAWKAGAITRTSAELLAFYVAFQAFGELLMGRGPDDGDKDKDDPSNKALQWARWFFRKLLSAPLQTNPVTGELVPWVDAALTGRRVQARPGVLSSYIGAAGQGFIDAMDTGEKKSAVQQGAAATKAVFFSLGLPVAPVNNASYLLDTTLGERPVDGPAAFVSGAIYGERDKNQPTTPPMAAGELFEWLLGD